MRFSHTGLVSISLAAFLLLWPGMTQLVSAQTLTALQAGAESGDPESQYELARAYESGKGVIQDDFEAVRWLRAAAAQDHPTAALDLGWMLANGYGVTKDIDQAYFWFSRAAALGAEGAIDQRDALASALDGSARRVLEQEALSGIDNPVLSAPPSPALAMDSDTASLTQYDPFFQPSKYLGHRSAAAFASSVAAIPAGSGLIQPTITHAIRFIIKKTTTEL